MGQGAYSRLVAAAHAPRRRGTPQRRLLRATRKRTADSSSSAERGRMSGNEEKRKISARVETFVDADDPDNNNLMRPPDKKASLPAPAPPLATDFGPGSRRVSPFHRSIEGDETSADNYVDARAIFTGFCNRTSSHGVPFFGTSSFFGRWVWMLVFASCALLFLIQTYLTMRDYFQYRTILEMSLRFEPPPFPAATVCNLNAFKWSLLREYEEIFQSIALWEEAMNEREEARISGFDSDGESEKEPSRSVLDDRIEQDEAERRRMKSEKDLVDNADDREPGEEEEEDDAVLAEFRVAQEEVFLVEENDQSLSRRRSRRSLHFQPIFVRCSCMPTNQQKCVPSRNPDHVNGSVCLCFEDEDSGSIWPCYPATVWTVKTCRQCSHSNTCLDPSRPNASLPMGEPRACLCQPISRFCVIHPQDEIRWWNPNNYTVLPGQPRGVNRPAKDVEDAYGLKKLKDKGAITTRTKENIIFLVAGLPLETRQKLSYTLNEFVLRCSFNSKDCDMQRAFKLHMNPEYGNCFTFNFNNLTVLKNSRAGPMYGLRLLLNVNQSDYLPTTEAAGVRIVVHEKDQEPFPDTFGYSAPTGFVSSFGLKTKVLHRLDEPYGHCSDVIRPDGYIYGDNFSPEGCYRNCFQHLVLHECGCGDPRLPLPTTENRTICDAQSPDQRSCLQRTSAAIGNFYHLQRDCKCVQPCTEHVYETSYSASAWPALSFNIGQDCPAVLHINNDSAACTEYYRLNTAYIEIYYEQLNYETLKETAGYTLVNVLSDFGGNIGLWIGFSVITMIEIVELIVELFYYGAMKGGKVWQKSKRRAAARTAARLTERGHLARPRIYVEELRRQLARDTTADTMLSDYTTLGDLEMMRDTRSENDNTI